MGKTVKDLKKGDTIYYWSHLKLYPQKLAEDIQIIKKHFVGMDWSGKPLEYDKMFYLIRPENGKQIKLNEYLATTDRFRANGSLRFTDIHAFIDWAIRHKDHCKKKVGFHTRRLMHYQKIVTKINESLLEIGD